MFKNSRYDGERGELFEFQVLEGHCPEEGMIPGMLLMFFTVTCSFLLINMPYRILHYITHAPVVTWRRYNYFWTGVLLSR